MVTIKSKVNNMNLKVNIIKEDVFILLEDVVVESLVYKITVKKGFDFDGASIPQAFWGVYGNPLSGNFRIAALVHDVLYASQKVSRDSADDIFLDLMKQHKVGYLKRQSMYYAVRSAGWYSWKQLTREEIEKYKEFVDVEKINS